MKFQMQLLHTMKVTGTALYVIWWDTETELHEDPQIPNFTQERRGIKLYEGMTLAIEPMVAAGGYAVKWLDDDWTVVTADHSLAAHYENTVLVTKNGPEILSLVEE